MGEYESSYRVYGMAPTEVWRHAAECVGAAGEVAFANGFNVYVRALGPLLTEIGLSVGRAGFEELIRTHKLSAHYSVYCSKGIHYEAEHIFHDGAMVFEASVSPDADLEITVAGEVLFRHKARFDEAGNWDAPLEEAARRRFDTIVNEERAKLKTRLGAAAAMFADPVPAPAWAATSDDDIPF